MEPIGGVLGGIFGRAEDAYSAKVKADTDLAKERERQKGIVNVVRTALPWVVGGAIVIAFIIYVIARRRKKAIA